jgi:hypothetical protein
MAPGLPVLLLSAPGAGLYGGCLWWLKLIEAAGFGGQALLDCGDAPGRAVEAIRARVSGVVLACEPELFAAVAAFGAAQGVLVLGERPPALDLGGRGAERKLQAWLAGEPHG